MFKELENLTIVYHSFAMIIAYAHMCNTEGKQITKAGYWTYCTQKGIDLLPDQMS